VKRFHWSGGEIDGYVTDVNTVDVVPGPLSKSRAEHSILKISTPGVTADSIVARILSGASAETAIIDERCMAACSCMRVKLRSSQRIIMHECWTPILFLRRLGIYPDE